MSCDLFIIYNYSTTIAKDRVVVPLKKTELLHAPEIPSLNAYPEEKLYQSKSIPLCISQYYLQDRRHRASLTSHPEMSELTECSIHTQLGFSPC